MLRGFFRKTVDAWLDKNSHRFERTPHVLSRGPSDIRLGFAGVPANLYVHLSSRGSCEIVVMQDDFCWDFLGDFDLSEQRTVEGFYFCRLCLQRTFFRSRKELWVAHCLETLLVWSNRELKPGRALYLYELRDGGATWARIRPAPGTAGASDAASVRFVYPFE